MNESFVLIGFMGAGKTSVGRVLSDQMGAPLLDTDQMIEDKAGMSISHLFETRGEDVFRCYETQMLEELLSSRADGPAVISTGGGLPMRAENRVFLHRLGIVVYLKAEPETVIKRLEGDTTRPLLAGNNALQKVQKLMDQRGPVYEESAHVIVSVDNKAPKEIANEILNKCNCENTEQLGKQR